MTVAHGAHANAPRKLDWLPRLRWALRGAGSLACVAAVIVTPEIVAGARFPSEPLTPIGVESLGAYRALTLAAGISLLAFAQFLPRLAVNPELLLGPISGLLPLGILTACVGLKLVLGPEHTAYKALAREDGPIEYATSFAYLGAACVAWVVARGLRGRGERVLAWLWTVLSLALVAVCGEEISWGQRLFGVQTPELLNSNIQGEMNLHNLPIVQRVLHSAYVAVGLFGALAWALVPERSTAAFREFARWVLPPGSLFSYFLPVALFYLVFDYTPERWIGSDNLRLGFISPYDQEPVEMLLALGFLLFALHAWFQLRSPSIDRSQPGSPSAPGRRRISPR